MKKKLVETPDLISNGRPVNDPPVNDQPSETPTTGPDPFDPASLRLPPNMMELRLKKVLLSVPVRKPEKSWFVRVNPHPEYQLKTAVLELKDDRAETYLVSPALWPELTGEATFVPRALFLAVNRQGVHFIWPIRLPGPDGRTDEWSRTAGDAAKMAEQKWIRITANMSLGAYDVFPAPGTFPDPEWPDVSLNELLKIAFKDRRIDDHDHPILRKLGGEI